ncbi:MAG: Histidinol dehydrogenase [Syntrophomonadaceae bacterium]|nr:Histidinol dehydrogenase [Bacillota bacterium]
MILCARKDKEIIDGFIERSVFNETVDRKVKKIIHAVAKEGDKALIRYTQEFDGVSLREEELRLSQKEIATASKRIDHKLRQVIRDVEKSIKEFQRMDMRKSWSVRKSGLLLGKLYQPLERVGIYVPGGEKPLISSLLMTVVPAIAAGVNSIAIASPPKEEGLPHPYIIGAAHLLGIKEVYRIGGAQAIAAFAFGTQRVKKVDKIFGPGNKFVISAKRQVFGKVGIDLLPGPSEIVILTDATANARFIAADLKAQAEHNEGMAILITHSPALAQEVEKEAKGFHIIVTRTLKESIFMVNEIAPEHLEIMVEKPRKILKEIKNSGAIFLGDYSPVALGDYSAGPSHILPTGGTAKFSAGLSVDDFRKSINVISCSQKRLHQIGEMTLMLAEVECLHHHAASVTIRKR